MITTRGLVKCLVVLLLLAVSITMFGCGPNDCVDKQVKYYERVPVTQANSHVEQETYTYQQPSVEQICGKEFSYEVTYDDKFWIDEPAVEGEINQVKRTAFIHNHENKIGEFGFDLLYMEDGAIVERTINPSKTLVAANGERRLFLAWATEYAPGKDIKIDVIDVPQSSGEETCQKIVKYTNLTGVRDKTVTSESTSYENVIKTKTVTVCD
ncbi:hypothetical protein ACFL96_06765 [Thermoproteota archaeon]